MKIFVTRILIILVVVLCSGNVFIYGNHSSDSLKLILKKTSGDEKMTLLYSIASEYYNIGNYDSAFFFAHQVLLQKDLSNKPLLKAKVHNTIGSVHMVRSNFDSSLSHYFKSLELSVQSNDSPSIAKSHTNIGLVYYRQNLYGPALNNFYKALKIDYNNNDSINLSQDYRDIGMVYKARLKYDKANEFYFKALRVQKKLNDTVNMSITHYNIGNIYDAKGISNKALLHYDTAILLLKANNFENQYPIAYYKRGISLIQKKNGDYENAYKNLNEALSIYKTIGETKEIGTIYYDLGDLNFRTHQYKESRKLIEKAKNIAKSNNDIWLLKFIHYNLSSLDSISGDYYNALKNYKLYSLYNDSLNNKKTIEEITKLQMNFAFSQKEDSIVKSNQQQLALKELTLEKRKEQQGYLLIGILMLGVIGGLLLYQNQIQKRNFLKLTKLNKALDEKVAQNQILVKEMHHRIKNNLYMVYSLLNIQAYKTSNKETHDHLKSASQRIESIANTHEQLLRNNDGHIDLEFYITEFVNTTLQQIETRIPIKAQINIQQGIKLNSLTCMPIAMLINEWLTNSAKHSKCLENLMINIFCSEVIDGNLKLEYYDNGMSIDNHTQSDSKGIGLRIIQLLSKQMEGELTIDNSKPFHYVLVFPNSIKQ